MTLGDEDFVGVDIKKGRHTDGAVPIAIPSGAATFSPDSQHM
jgi:hypothetical protein